MVADHITQLETIFKKINSTAGIVDFDHQKNYIDFLNVKSFDGSQIGSMNLAQPDKWQGPYVKENLTMQEQNYQIVRTHKGYFIVPGEGVKLSSGKIIGKDIIFAENTDIPALIADGNELNFQGRPLAAQVPMQSMAVRSAVEQWDNEALDVG
jgi:hypothetical protein